MKVLYELLKNQALISMVLSFVIAQTVKGLINLNVRKAFSYGGMPSGHSAMVVGLGISIGLEMGWDSPVFALAVGFSMIVISDAVRFRRKVDRRFGHTWMEVFVGGIIGFFVAVLLNLCYSHF